MALRLASLVKSCLLLSAAISSASLAAETAGEGKVTGKVYTNWSYNATDDSNLTKRSQFDLTRAYFGYNYTINEQFSTSLTLDVERINGLTKVDTIKFADTVTAADSVVKQSIAAKTSKDERYEAFLKTAYLQYKCPTTGIVTQAGLIPLFQFGLQEKFWGYRYLAKSYMDEYKFGSSADLGFSLKYKIVEQVQINAGLIHGEGYKKPQDINGLYKPALGVELRPVKGLVAYIYGDYMPIDDPKSDDEATITVAGFLGYEIKDKFRIGAEYNNQMNQQGYDARDVSGISAYASYNILKPLEVFARFDLLTSAEDWNIAADGQAIIAGVQYSPIKNVKVAADFQGFLPTDENKVTKTLGYVHLEFAF